MVRWPHHAKVSNGRKRERPAGCSLLRHACLAQAGEIGGFEQGADLWHAPKIGYPRIPRPSVEQCSKNARRRPDPSGLNARSHWGHCAPPSAGHGARRRSRRGGRRTPGRAEPYPRGRIDRRKKARVGGRDRSSGIGYPPPGGSAILPASSLDRISQIERPTTIRRDSVAPRATHRHSERWGGRSAPR